MVIKQVFAAWDSTYVIMLKLQTPEGTLFAFLITCLYCYEVIGS